MPEPEEDIKTPAEIDAAESSREDERVAELLMHTIDVPALAEAVEQQEAADAADTLEQIEDAEAADVLIAMQDSRAAEALAEIEEPLALGVIEGLIDEDRAAYASRLLELMAPDDAADLLQALDDDPRDLLYREMDADAARMLRRLAGYDEDSAGGLMTTDYVELREDQTVGEATETIRARTIPDEMNHLPVVDARGRLAGIVSLRALLLGNDGARVGDLIEGGLRAVRFDVDQEDVAHEFDRYDHYMMPVIDRSDRVVGIVTVDDVIDIIREEQTEDVQKTVGAGAGEAVYSGLGEKLRGRFPWLAASLIMTCAAAIVVLLFRDLISEHPILAFLMPVIAALVGNAWHQALAVTLRGIVLDQVRPERVRPLIAREAAVGMLNGIALGVLMLVLVGVFADVFNLDGASWQIGAVAGLAMACSMCAGTLAGSAIPLIMRRLGADPAQSSAIFLIMATDAVAFATFLGLARVAHGWL